MKFRKSEFIISEGREKEREGERLRGKERERETEVKVGTGDREVFLDVHEYFVCSQISQKFQP
jgi:hypothetical protein